jgi:hypothetical protein
MNWKNDVCINPATSGELYQTRSLVELFTNLDNDGYSGLSLGLIIDLIRRDAEGAN